MAVPLGGTPLGVHDVPQRGDAESSPGLSGPATLAPLEAARAPKRLLPGLPLAAVTLRHARPRFGPSIAAAAPVEERYLAARPGRWPRRAAGTWPRRTALGPRGCSAVRGTGVARRRVPRRRRWPAAVSRAAGWPRIRGWRESGSPARLDGSGAVVEGTAGAVSTWVTGGLEGLRRNRYQPADGQGAQAQADHADADEQPGPAPRLARCGGGASGRAGGPARRAGRRRSRPRRRRETGRRASPPPGGDVRWVGVPAIVGVAHRRHRRPWLRREPWASRSGGWWGRARPGEGQEVVGHLAARLVAGVGRLRERLLR